jgi:transcriptional regulator with XRE-family HTH domain
MKVKMSRIAGIDLDVGFRVRRLREEFGLSQGELAERIGVSFQQVQKYETGKNKVSLRRLSQIAKVFNTNISHFLQGLDNQNESGTTRGGYHSMLPVLDDEERRLLKFFRRIKSSKFKRGVLLQLRAICDLESKSA